VLAHEELGVIAHGLLPSAVEARLNGSVSEPPQNVIDLC
jgi:hypothetical protein